MNLYLEYLKKYPPRIVLKGWWWKKYFSYYRSLREIMQELSDYSWKNGGAEEFEKEQEKAFRTTLDKNCYKVLSNGFSINKI